MAAETLAAGKRRLASRGLIGIKACSLRSRSFCVAAHMRQNASSAMSVVLGAIGILGIILGIAMAANFGRALNPRA
jgi:hypothetical protein